MALPVVYHSAYLKEWQALPPAERAAMAAAVAPEAERGQRGFEKALAGAEQRLSEVED